MDKEKDSKQFIDSPNLDMYKTFYYVETAIHTFRSNNLTEVLCMWYDAYVHDDEIAFHVGRLG